MALVFADSFDHYPYDKITAKWTSQFLLSGSSIGTGRTGNGLNILGSIRKTLNYSSSWTIGFAFKRFSTTGGDLYSGTAGIKVPLGTTLMVAVNLLPDNTIVARVGAKVIAAVSAESISVGTFHYIEIAYTLGGSGTNLTLSITIRVNGEIILEESDNTTLNISNIIVEEAKVNHHIISGGSTIGASIIDDLYMIDGEEGHWIAPEFIGDVKILAIYPNEDISKTWTGVPGDATHYVLVNEHSPDNDGTYIQSETLDDEDLFGWEDIPLTVGEVFGAHYLGYMRKDAEGSRAVRLTAGTAGDSKRFFLNNNYKYHHYMFEEGPSGLWTPATFNVHNFGVKVVDHED